MKSTLLTLTAITLISGLTHAQDFSKVKCDLTKEGNFGTLCALKPSVTNSGINDTDPSGTGLGYGHHVIGIPTSQSETPDIHIHFTGSFGKAYNENTQEFKSEQFLNEALEAGKLVIQLAYNNSDSINLNTCNTEDGLSVDDCAGLAREEKLTGSDVSPFNETAIKDSIDFRIKKLIRYLKIKKVLPSSYFFGWRNTSLSGHSQGAGMTHFIAKRRKIKRGCMLAGGYDMPDLVNPSEIELADWITRGSYKTSKEKLTAVLHTRDKFYTNLAYVNDYLGLEVMGNVYESSKFKMSDINGNRVTDGHVAAINATQLKDLRMDACFY